jgi:hypothetical protein
MTTSALAFARGDIFKSFYIQPAAALMCSLLLMAAFFAFLTAALGLHFQFLGRLHAELTAKHVILALMVVIAAGWMVTLARALAAK